MAAFIRALACLSSEHAGLGWHPLFVRTSVEHFVEHPAVEGRTIVDALEREDGWGDGSGTRHERERPHRASGSTDELQRRYNQQRAGRWQRTQVRELRDAVLPRP